MSYYYSEVRQNLQAVKAEIDDLLEYIEANQSESDKRLVDLEIYSRLANISTSVLKSAHHDLLEDDDNQQTCQKLI